MSRNVSEEPLVSIIISNFYQLECSPNSKFPYYLYASPIKGCIEAAQSQDYKHKEIILADKDVGQGAAYIRNEAIERAKGEIIYFNDADAIMADNHIISDLVKFFKETDSDVIVGGSIPNRKISPYFTYLLELEYEERENNMGENYISAGATTYMGIKKEVLEKTGGFPLGSSSIYTGDLYFDSSFADWDFCGILREKGYKIRHTNKFKVFHIYQTKMLNYFEKQTVQGWYRIAYVKRFKRIREGYTTYKMIAQPFFLATIPIWLTLGFIYSPNWFNVMYLVFLTVLFWHIDMVARFYRKTKDLGVFLLLPVTFIRSFCWGLGATKGILDFFILKRYLPKDNR